MKEQFLVFKAEGFEPTYTKDGKYGLTLFLRRNGLAVTHQIDIWGTCNTLDEAKALINNNTNPKVEVPSAEPESPLFLGSEIPKKKGKAVKKPKPDAE
jgi:hypothetical protein